MFISVCENRNVFLKKTKFTFHKSNNGELLLNKQYSRLGFDCFSSQNCYIPKKLKLNVTKSVFRQQVCKEFRDTAIVPAEFCICQSSENEFRK